METVTLEIRRLRHLLSVLEEEGGDYRICAARDIAGPGGGVYITAQTPLDGHHLSWLEHRNPDPERGTYVEVVFRRTSGAEVSPPALLDQASAHPGIPQKTTRRERAAPVAREVRKRAAEVASSGQGLYQALARRSPGRLEVDESEAAAEFEERVRSFHQAVRHAIDEYLQGNTLVMDLITRFHLGKKEVRHGLQVAAFATELTVQLALRQPAGGGNLRSYFDDGAGAGPLEGRRTRAPQQDSTEAEVGRDEELGHRLRKYLAEIFLGGFMHDCGLWTESLTGAWSHETQGARLIWRLKELKDLAPSLVAIVLFHSDVMRLAHRHGVIRVERERGGDGSPRIEREFFRSEEQAQRAVQEPGSSDLVHKVTEDDLRKIVPVAMAERYVTEVHDFAGKRHREIINDLARHVTGGIYMRYLAALCNSQVHVVAPRRAYVRLSGTLPIPAGRQSGRVQRWDVTGFEAGSLGHLQDRGSPHLITLFVRGEDGGRVRAGAVDARDHALWDRSGGPYGRMYVPAGRLLNTLALRVTGFLGEQIYDRVLDSYERELAARLEE